MDAVRARLDIVDVINKYVPLTRKGKDYVGVCPFHDDHDPSMRVSPDKQIFKCFVCGAGGNVFSFIQKYEHVSFLEAVSKAAAAAGIPFAYTSQAAVQRQSPYQPLYNTLATFIDYAGYTLTSREGSAALQYLKERKFDDKIIETFQIGYAPEANRIAGFFQAKKVDPRFLIDTGLTMPDSAQPDQPGKPRFTERIIIPIHDRNGNPVGLTARKLPSAPDSLPKYINTSTTPVYEKGNTVFNYHRVKDIARKEGYVVLVEGAMDVLGLEKAGIHTGVAMLGTAFTPVQLQMLADLRVTVRVFYDKDNAGQKAVWKFGQAALQAGIPFVVVDNQESKDPDEIFIQNGAEILQQTVNRTISFVEFAFTFLQTQYDLHNYEDRQTYARMMADLIYGNADVHEAGSYYQRLKELTGLDYSFNQKRPPLNNNVYPGYNGAQGKASGNSYGYHNYRNPTDPFAQPDFYQNDQGHEHSGRSNPAGMPGQNVDTTLPSYSNAGFYPEANTGPAPGQTPDGRYHGSKRRPYGQYNRYNNGYQNGKRRYNPEPAQNYSMDMDSMDLLPAMEEGRLQAEKAVLAAMLMDRKYADRFKSEIGFFKNPLCHRLSLYIYEAYRRHGQIDLDALNAFIEEQEARELLAELLSIEKELISDDLYWDSLFKIKDQVLGEQIEICEKAMKQELDSQQKIQHMLKKRALIRQRNELRQRKEVSNG